MVHVQEHPSCHLILKTVYDGIRLDVIVNKCVFLNMSSKDGTFMIAGKSIQVFFCFYGQYAYIITMKKVED